MTPGHLAALDRAFIQPPPAGSRKTTCPRCSHMRVKRHEPCLMLYPLDGWIDWKCYHCGWHDGDVA